MIAFQLQWSRSGGLYIYNVFFDILRTVLDMVFIYCGTNFTVAKRTVLHATLHSYK